MPTTNLKNITIKQKQKNTSIEFIKSHWHMLYKRYKENGSNERYCQNEIPSCPESSCMIFYPKENTFGTITKKFTDFSTFF